MKECLGGWINFPKALRTTNGTTLSLWGTPAAQKGPPFVIHLLKNIACNAHTPGNGLQRWNQMTDDGFPTKVLCHHCAVRSCFRYHFQGYFNSCIMGLVHSHPGQPALLNPGTSHQISGCFHSWLYCLHKYVMSTISFCCIQIKPAL